MQSKARTVKDYLAELSPDRRSAISAVRKVVRDNLDKGYTEGMQYGAIGYFVPYSVYSAGYHCSPNEPLPFAGLASQKNHMALYLMCLYGEGDTWAWFQEAWAKTGKKLDMGKCCLRFKKLDDLALDVIAELIRRVPAAKFIEFYDAATQATRQRRGKRRPTKAARSAIRNVAEKPTQAASKKSLAPKRPAAKRKATTRKPSD